MGKHYSGHEIVKAAQKHGCSTRVRGDHCIVTPPRGKDPSGRGYMVVPLKRELATGTEHSILKWCAALGIVLTIVGMFLYKAIEPLVCALMQ